MFCESMLCISPFIYLPISFPASSTLDVTSFSRYTLFYTWEPEIFPHLPVPPHFACQSAISFVSHALHHFTLTCIHSQLLSLTHSYSSHCNFLCESTSYLLDVPATDNAIRSSSWNSSIISLTTPSVKQPWTNHTETYILTINLSLYLLPFLTQATLFSQYRPRNLSVYSIIYFSRSM